MNLYIIVEGSQSEMQIFPAWISLLAPHMQRVEYAQSATDNNYYLMTGGGIPSIYHHISNAVAEIIDLHQKGVAHYDYLIISMDTEEENRQYILQRISETLAQDNRTLNGFQIELCEQQVCIETWLLGNQKVFKKNPQSMELREFINFFNVNDDNPEQMKNINTERFSTTAQFHLKYLKEMLKERNMSYSKSKNGAQDVCTKSYLDELIKRYKVSGNILTFGRWLSIISKI